MSGISLTASMRSNLLSLQNIAGQQDITQNRLATGLKVSSAIDNPSSYYTASSLNNRAADLTALLDSMSQGIQTIKAASEAIDSGTKFLEQAKAVANQALETSEDIIAEVSTEAELLAAVNSGQRGLIVVDGDIVLSENQLVILGEGQSLVGSNYFGSGKTVSLTFDFKGTASSGLIIGNGTMVSDLQINYTTDTVQYGTYGAVEIKENSKNVILRNLEIDFNMTTASMISGKALAGIYAKGATVEASLQGIININDLSPLNIGDGNSNSSFSRGILGSISSLTAYDSDKCATFTIRDQAVVNITSNARWGHAVYETNLVMKGNSRLNIETNGANVCAGSKINLVMQDCSNLNYKGNGSGGALFEKSHINLNSVQTQINAILPGSDIFALPAILKSVAGAKMAVNGQVYQCVTEIKDPVSLDDGFLPAENFKQTGEVAPAFPDIVAEMAKFLQIENASDIIEKSRQYQEIIKQYDMLISDASYKGINLLEGQYLKINFNEDRSSKIDVPGVKADSESLGLKTREWSSSQDIEASIGELETAISSLRGFASEFGNYYSIVTTRQDFTENLINVLEEGADKLTLADMNQESASMLALQTAQQLAVNSLSLASKASQSILKLF